MTEELMRELISVLESMDKSIQHLDRTLFDTLGSGKTGAALDSIVRIADLVEAERDY